jgi:hypothetical protein
VNRSEAAVASTGSPSRRPSLRFGLRRIGLTENQRVSGTVLRLCSWARSLLFLSNANDEQGRKEEAKRETKGSGATSPHSKSNLNAILRE